MKWNSATALGASGNFWNDAALTLYDPRGYLDFYQIHYYGWMNGDEKYWSFSPLFNDWFEASFDKLTVIGKAPANGVGTNRTPVQLLPELHANCYAGVWLWSSSGVDDNGRWADVSDAVRTPARTVPTEVRIAKPVSTLRIFLPPVQTRA